MRARLFLQLLLLVTTLQTLSCRRDSTIAEVGSFRITAADAKRRDEVIRIYYPEEKRAMGIEQLIQTYTYAQILMNQGLPISDEVLEKEAARIDSTTLMPEILERIKRIFGEDRLAYLHNYVLPVYAERVIYYEFFLHDSRTQTESRTKAQALLNQARRDPKNFCASAKKNSLSCARFKVSRAGGLEFQPEVTRNQNENIHQAPPSTSSPVAAELEERRQSERSAEGLYWIQQIAASLKPGELHPDVQDRGESWLVARYLGPIGQAKDTLRFDGVLVPKADFAGWLEIEKARVQVKRY